MAKLVPVPKPFSWAELGCLDNDDPFFKAIDEIVANRHMPRAVRTGWAQSGPTKPRPRRGRKR